MCRKIGEHPVPENTREQERREGDEKYPRCAILQSQDLSLKILPESVVILKFCKPYVKDECSWKKRAKNMVFHKENSYKSFLSLWLLKVESLCAYKFQTDMLVLLVDVTAVRCLPLKCPH